MQTHNPATGVVLATHPVLSPEALEQCLQRAHAASAAWRNTPIAQRAPHLHAIAAALEDHSEALANLIRADEVREPPLSDTEDAARVVIATDLVELARRAVPLGVDGALASTGQEEGGEEEKRCGFHG